MIYLSSFKLSDKKVNNPNIYPYNVFRGKYIDVYKRQELYSPTIMQGKICRSANGICIEYYYDKDELVYAL